MTPLETPQASVPEEAKPEVPAAAPVGETPKRITPESFDEPAVTMTLLQASKSSVDKPVEPPAKPKRGPSLILDASGKPFGEDNAPSDREPRAKFEPVPTIKPEKKVKRESALDPSKLKALKEQVRDLNERYIATEQKEEKANLYSQLQEAQGNYRKLQEEFDKALPKSERERKIAKLEDLREEIRVLNEKYLSEAQ